MNIQKYRWPVIIAASLHGALFMSTPDSSTGRIKPASAKQVDLPPIPEERTIEVEEPKTGADAFAKGGPAVRKLPEPIESPGIKTSFEQPMIEQPRFPKYENSLRELPGAIDGWEGGSIDYSQHGIVSVGNLDRQPRATAQMSPDYPSAMMQQGVGGSVLVEFDVSVEGRVVRAEAVRYTRSEFVEPALRAVRRWRFEPGRRNGRVVSFRMIVPIEFGLEN